MRKLFRILQATLLGGCGVLALFSSPTSEPFPKFAVHFAGNNVVYTYGLLGTLYDVSSAQSVTDPYGKELDISSGKVLLSIATGYYSIQYANKSERLKVYEEKPDDIAILQGEYPASMNVGEAIVLPTIQIRSGIVRTDPNAPKIGSYDDYYLEIYEDGALLTTIAKENLGQDYFFEEPGAYEFDYCYTDVFRDLMRVPYLLEVKDKPTIVAYSLPSFVDIHNTVSLSGVYGYDGGVRYAVEKTYVAPSGETGTLSDVFEPKELGTYTLRFTFSLNGETVRREISITSTNGGSGLLKERIGLGTITAGNRLPSNVQGMSQEGLNVTFQDASASFYYGKTIDLSALDGNDLAEFLPNPTANPGTIKEMAFRLIDAYDSSNVLSLRFQKNDIYANQTIVRAGYNGVEYGETLDANGNALIGGDGNLIDWGFSVCWDGAMGPAENINSTYIPLNFTYNSESSEFSMRTQKSDLASNHRIRICNAKDRLGFPGFRGNEVYLSVTVNNGTGDVLFTSLNGESPSEVTESTFAGNESVLLGKKGFSSLPVGVVGVAYPLPSLLVTNPFGSDYDFIYALSKDGKDISNEIENGRFVPKAAGEYTISCQITNQYDIQVSKEGSFQVDTARTPMDIVVSFPAQPVRRKENFMIPSIQVTGGNGVTHYSAVLLLDGVEQQPIVTGDVVPLSNLGVYAIRVTAVDELGFTDCKDFPISIDDDFLYFHLDSLPRSIDLDESFVIPTPVAINFATQKKPTISAFLNGKSVSLGEEVTFQDVGTKTLTYVINQGSTDEETHEFTFRVLDRNTEMSDLSTYFALGGGIDNVTATSDGASFTYHKETEGNATIDLPYLLSNNGLSISFDLLETTPNLESVDFLLTGKNGKTLQFGVHHLYYSKKERAELWINDAFQGVYLQAEQGAYVSGDYAKINYRHYYLSFNGPLKKIANANLQTLGETLYWSDGTPFAGFPEGGCYLTIRLGGINDAGTFLLRAISNQSFAKAALEVGDRIPPSLGWESVLAKNNYLSQGDIVSVPAVGAYDMFCHTSSLTLTLTNPDGTRIKDSASSEAFSFKLEKTGQYILLFTTKDKANRRGNYLFTFEARDSEAPTLSVAGSYETSYALHSTITILSATANDNASTSLYLGASLIFPDGYRKPVTFGEDITLDDAGTYELRYVAMDQDGNQTCKSFTWEVR